MAPPLLVVSRSADAAALGRQTQSTAANEFVRRLLPIVQAIRASGTTNLRDLAAGLHERGIRSPRGTQWHVSSVINLLARKPVQALLALAKSRGLGVPNAPGDREELIRILWSHARSKDKAHSIKASAELNRIMDAQRAAEQVPSEHDLANTLDSIAEILPAFAAHLATKHSIDWTPSREQGAAVEKARRDIALAWLEEQRAKQAETQIEKVKDIAHA